MKLIICLLVKHEPMSAAYIYRSELLVNVFRFVHLLEILRNTLPKTLYSFSHTPAVYGISGLSADLLNCDSLRRFHSQLLVAV